MIARFLICGACLATIIWGLCVFPLLWRSAGLQRVAKNIVQGEVFNGDAIGVLADKLDSTADEAYPIAKRSAAIIRLRALEKSLADGGSRTLDGDMRKLRASIRASLVNAPADSFLWAVLYWLENAEDGFSQDHLRLLRMSYSQGPNEGWIAVKRNRQALAIFSQLSPELRGDAINEFAGLVRSGFIAPAADLLVGSGRPIRERLLAELRDAPQIQRERLAKAVYSLGYDIVIPGVKPPARRPWR